MRKINRIITLSILVTMISSFSFGCGNDTPGGDETTVATETPTTTPEPTTTEEPTTTGYVFKGKQFAVYIDKKDIFYNLVVEKGYKIALNDIVGENDGTDGERGNIGRDLIIALYLKNHIDNVREFENNYWEPGADNLEISYSQNVLIEYNEEEKMYFHFVRDNGIYAYFDVYEIN